MPRVPWAWAEQLTLPADVQHGYVLGPTARHPKAATLSTPDGSRTEIDLGVMPAEVREVGPTSLWDHIDRPDNTLFRWSARTAAAQA